MSKPETTQQPVSLDPFAPGDIARRLEAINVTRAGLSVRRLILLGLVGGIYISFGGALATLVLTDNTLGYGLGRLAAGLSFSLGLIMLVLAGGELFTGNNLMVLALAGRKIAGRAMLRNWAIVYPANAAGAVLLAFAIHYSGVLEGNGVKATAVKIAEAKAQLDAPTAFLRGVLCNMLVCLAVWLSVAARSVEGKVIAIAFPISAFVALGFEHCVANFYLLTIGLLSGAKVTAVEFIGNITSVTIGNTLGGIVLAVILYLIYLGKDQVQRSFSRPVLVAPSTGPSKTTDAAAPIVDVPATEPTAEIAVEEPVRPAAVRLRLKSEHGRPVAQPEKDTAVTKLVFLGSRREGGGGRK
jgi:formate transporter